MIGKHTDNRYYAERGTQGEYYFNDTAGEGEVVYIPEYAFEGKDFLVEGDRDMYTMADLRTAATYRLEGIEGYTALPDERKAEEVTRLVRSFIEWSADGEAWCYPETYFDDIDIEI